MAEREIAHDNGAGQVGVGREFFGVFDRQQAVLKLEQCFL